MKKNIVQDVIPSKKSIRNVALFPKAKKFEDEASIPPPPVSTLPYTYEYDEPTKPSRKILYISISLFILAALFGISAFFKSATVRITPKQEIKALNNNFKALKNVSTGELGFQIVTTTKGIEKTLTGGVEQKVLKKARGIIVVYNNYGTQSQKLVVNTRFQTPEGLIFRALEGINIPPKEIKNGKTVAGSVEVAVEGDVAGSEYNIGLKDFTIPGFKGDPKYSKIYARSKTEMSGGFSGMQKVLSKEVLEEVSKELEENLKVSLLKDISSQIPENFVLYPNGLFYRFEPITETNPGTGTDISTSNIILKKKGTISAILFDKGSLSRIIIAKIMPDAAQDIVKITNLDRLNFTLQAQTSFDPNTDTLIDFSLNGNVNFVWVVDENKLKTELLGLSKKNANTVISTYKAIKEAWVLTYPFWSQTIPTDPKKVTLVNTLTR